MAPLNMFFLIVFLSLSPNCFPQSSPYFMCPTEIKVEEQKLEKKIHGWEPFIDVVNLKIFLQGVTFYDGHPKELASLVPDNEGQKVKFLIWNFPDKNPRPFYISCSYSKTSLMLIKEIPKGIKSCRVNYGDSFSTITSITCK